MDICVCIVCTTSCSCMYSPRAAPSGIHTTALGSTNPIHPWYPWWYNYYLDTGAGEPDNQRTVSIPVSWTLEYQRTRELMYLKHCMEYQRTVTAKSVPLKLVRGDQFWQQKWSPRTCFGSKSGPPRTGFDFQNWSYMYPAKNNPPKLTWALWMLYAPSFAL